MSEFCPLEGNLSRRGVRQRQSLALLGLAGTLIMVCLGASGSLRFPWLGLVFVPLLWLGLGALQARESTCIALAAQGVAESEAGFATVEDKRLRSELRLRSVRIAVTAVAFAAGTTWLIWLWLR